MFMTSLLSQHLLQVFQDATPAIPPGVPEWLGLAVLSGTLTEVIKRLTKLTGWKISGKAAVAASFVASIAVVLADLANGGSLVTIPAAYAGGNPWQWFAGVLIVAGETTAAANAIYLFVYDRVFGSASEPPAELAALVALSALPNWKVLKAFTGADGLKYSVGQIVARGSIGTVVINAVTYTEANLANSGYIRPWP